MGHSDDIIAKVEAAVNIEQAIKTIREYSAALSSSFTIRRKEEAARKLFQSAIISQEELIDYVEKGWELLRDLKDDQYLMRKPIGIPC